MVKKDKEKHVRSYVIHNGKPVSFSAYRGAFILTIEGILERHGPPRKISSLYDKRSLRMNNIGSVTLDLTLHSQPIERLGPCPLSQLATKVALDRMRDLKSLNELPDLWQYFDKAIENLDEDEQEKYYTAIKVIKNAYRASAACKITIWFYDEDTRMEIEGMLERAHLPISMVFSFIAQALSELPGISEKRKTLLQRDYKRGLFQINLLASVMKMIVSDMKACGKSGGCGK